MCAIDVNHHKNWGKPSFFPMDRNWFPLKLQFLLEKLWVCLQYNFSLLAYVISSTFLSHTCSNFDFWWSFIYSNFYPQNELYRLLSQPILTPELDGLSDDTIRQGGHLDSSCVVGLGHKWASWHLFIAVLEDDRVVTLNTIKAFIFNYSCIFNDIRIDWFYRNK